MSESADRLRGLAARHDAVAPSRSWEELVADAEMTTAVSAALASRHRRDDGTIDTAALAVDVADLYEHDELRQQLFDAARHGMNRTYGPLSDQEIIDRVLAMDAGALSGLSNNLQGASMELRVAELVEAGVIDLPEGASFHLNPEYTTPGYDGVLELEDGTEVLVQIKASDGAEILKRHLDSYPDIPTVYTNTEAAEAAAAAGVADAGEIVDTGIQLAGVTPGADGLVDEFTTSTGEALADVLDELPVLALGIVAAQAAWQIHRGADVQEQWERVRARSTSIGVWSAVGYGVEIATGSAGLRAVATVGGKGTIAATKAIESSAERVTVQGLNQLRSDRRLLAALATSDGTM